MRYTFVENMEQRSDKNVQIEEEKLNSRSRRRFLSRRTQLRQKLKIKYFCVLQLDYCTLRERRDDYTSEFSHFQTAFIVSSGLCCTFSLSFPPELCLLHVVSVQGKVQLEIKSIHFQSLLLTFSLLVSEKLLCERRKKRSVKHDHLIVPIDTLPFKHTITSACVNKRNHSNFWISSLRLVQPSESLPQEKGRMLKRGGGFEMYRSVS